MPLDPLCPMVWGMDVALYQPEIPENTAALMRLAACLGIRLHLIEPLGFALDTKKMRRVGMDYLDQVHLKRHVSYEKFKESRPSTGRLILATTKASIPHWDHQWADGDVLIMGQESAGVPEPVHQDCDVRITIPLSGQARSLNLAAATTLICGEWQRQRNVT